MPSSYPHLVIARIPEHIEPMDRGERYEDPLSEELQKVAAGEVTGGGSQLDENFFIRFVDIEICLANLDSAISLATKVLEDCGAPKGSKLLFEREGAEQEIHFGKMEGVTLTLDANLPAEDWERYAGEVWQTIENLLTEESLGAIHGSKATDEVTEVYLYGPSAENIIKGLKQFRSNFPLCKNSTVRVMNG